MSKKRRENALITEQDMCVLIRKYQGDILNLSMRDNKRSVLHDYIISAPAHIKLGDKKPAQRKTMNFVAYKRKLPFRIDADLPFIPLAELIKGARKIGLFLG